MEKYTYPCCATFKFGSLVWFYEFHLNQLAHKKNIEWKRLGRLVENGWETVIDAPSPPLLWKQSLIQSVATFRLQYEDNYQLRVPAFRTEHALQSGLEGENVRSTRAQNSKFVLEATFRFQYDFSVLSTRFKSEGRKLSKCACSELETRTRSRTRTPIWRSLI